MDTPRIVLDTIVNTLLRIGTASHRNVAHRVRRLNHDVVNVYVEDTLGDDRDEYTFRRDFPDREDAYVLSVYPDHATLVREEYLVETPDLMFDIRDTIPRDDTPIDKQYRFRELPTRAVSAVVRVIQDDTGLRCVKYRLMGTTDDDSIDLRPEFTPDSASLHPRA